VFLGGEGVGGRLTAPRDGVVHDVVVEQCERVHQFERGTGVDVDLVVGAAAGAHVPPVAEGRPEPFAA
jgi:hypothetical protein